MLRAGVFIGVDRTGQLQQLKDAAAGATRMHQWALSQGLIDQTNARLITDAGGAKVTPDQIYDAIKAIIDGPGVDQLLLYFAGHGVNINRGEQWLLTDAPVKTSAAVNVSGSVELARYSGIQHVVIISDACRSAAEGLQAQNVRGQDVFPNDAASDRAKPVDQFFACYLGRTAAEIRDPAVAATNYSALYTNALLDALAGKVPGILGPSPTAGDTCRYVRPRALQTHLEAEVPKRVLALGLATKVNQSPDAIITSADEWLSRIEAPPQPPPFMPPPAPGPGPVGGIGPLPGRPAPAPPPPAPAPEAAAPPVAPETLRAVTREMVRSVAEGTAAATDWRARTAPIAGGAGLVQTLETVATPFGPDHFETGCGIKVRGARITAFEVRDMHAELLGSGGDILRVSMNRPAASVLLQFEGGRGTVVPALQGFVAALTFVGPELVDVAYEPSTNDWRWDYYKGRADKVRTLRAIASSSSQHGRFRLEREDADSIAQEMQYAKTVDPGLAVYAAYAYYDLQLDERIRQMDEYLGADLGATFCDVALLARRMREASFRHKLPVVPFFPMLAQGWALLSANRLRLHPALDGIETSLQDSLWSLFDGAGLNKLSAALMSGDVV